MRIEKYTGIVFCLYLGIFLFSILIGFIEILRRLWKKTPKFWLGIIPYIIVYSFSAALGTIHASMVYDDIADPSYEKYKDWGLYDFIFHDIKTFIIWLVIGILFYLVFGRESTKKPIKTGCAFVLIVFMILWAFILVIGQI